jgi:outer membrane lipoprotein SlyB
MTTLKAGVIPALLLLLAGCVTVPPGPNVRVMPGSGKSFDQFRGDDFECRQYADQQVGGQSAAQAANNSAVASAAVGTLVGAAAGAAFNGSSGAAVGAGAGLLLGSAAGTSASQYSAASLQRRYDLAYEQCMYAKGNQIPVAQRYGYGRRAPPVAYSYPPPPPPGWTPPPPGTMPPPPPN